MKPPQWAINAADHISSIQNDNRALLTKESLIDIVVLHYEICAKADPLRAFVETFLAQDESKNQPKEKK